MGKKFNMENKKWQGIAQDTRMKLALNSSYVNIYEKDISQLMAFFADYAPLVTFINENNPAAAGDWADFFKNDISFYLAKIMATDLDAIERDRTNLLNKVLDSSNVAHKKTAFVAFFKHTIELAQLVNEWYIAALSFNDLTTIESTKLEKMLKQLIQGQLAEKLALLKTWEQEAAKSALWSKSIVNVDYSNYHSIWEFTNSKRKNIPFDEGDTDIQIVENALKKVRMVRKVIHNAIVYIIQRAAIFFQESLTQKADHQPAAALLIAFLQLFDKAVKHLNGMTKRHLDHYYKQILGLKMADAVPDKVHVLFEIAPLKIKHRLAKGTRLLGGRDDQDIDCFYKLDQNFLVSKAKIQALRTVFLEHNENIGIKSKYQLVTNVYAAPIADSKDGIGQAFIGNDKQWPPFGEAQFLRRGLRRNMQDASLGFVIASPLLALSEGMRKVTIAFQVDPLSTGILERIVRDISLHEALSFKETLDKIFKGNLVLELSSTETWFQVPAYKMAVEDNEDLSKVCLIFELFPVDPPICNYNSEALGPDLDTDLPVFKCALRSDSQIYAYTFFRNLILEKITINVEVEGLKNLTAFSNDGPLDVSKPFQAFGAVPNRGSYLLLGNPELFRKKLTNLTIELDWHNLPDLEGGLEAYYKDYGAEVKDEDFIVRLSALSGNNFLPTDKKRRQQFQLFSKKEALNTLSETTLLEDVDLAALAIWPDYFLEELSEFTNQTRTGFLKLELVQPKTVFGHELFPKVLSSVSLFNATPGKRGKPKKESELRPIPNLPISPNIRQAVINYKASTTINILAVRDTDSTKKSPDEFFHLGPFGNTKVFYENKASLRNLLPQFHHDGYLYIGLKDFHPPEELSMLIKMKPNQELNTLSIKPEITWWYQRGDSWVAISSEDILLDTTNGMTGTGIIQIKIPRDITTGTGVFDNDLHWLRITLKGATKGIPYITDIHLHASSATWVDNGHQRNPNFTLLPNSLKDLLRQDRAITAIKQPYCSFGGRRKENEVGFYTRVSERLRHKNRAITVWDYERLILEKFPNIFQTKCIPHQGSEKFVRKGSLYAVIVPKLNLEEPSLMPRATFQQINEVCEFLKQFASPFIDIEVRNPTYERLKISFGVRFKKGMNNGSYIEQLNRDIQLFICPWLFSTNQRLNIGGSLKKNDLLNYVRKRPYVEFVTKFSIVHIFDIPKPNSRKGGQQQGQKEHIVETSTVFQDTATDKSHSPFVEASTPWSVLIPMENHPIVFLEDQAYQAPVPAAIDSMLVGADFILKKKESTTKKRADAAVEKNKKYFFLKINLDL